MTPNYPNWICGECGEKYGQLISGDLWITFNPSSRAENRVCGWCDDDTKESVVPPRYYGRPKHPAEEPNG